MCWRIFCTRGRIAVSKLQFFEEEAASRKNPVSFGDIYDATRCSLVFHAVYTRLLFRAGWHVVFHVSTALLMGLNDFLFTMPLMYPAVLYLHTFFHTQLV